MTVEELRKVLNMYDEGFITQGEATGMVADKFFGKMVSVLESGQSYGWISSCCCAAGSHPQKKVFDCELTVEAHCISIKGK